MQGVDKHPLSAGPPALPVSSSTWREDKVQRKGNAAQLRHAHLCGTRESVHERAHCGTDPRLSLVRRL